MADLIPGTRGAEKPRVFLWEAAAAAVRVVGSADAPWFVAKDVCAALEHSNSRMALQRLDDDEKGVRIVYTLGGEQELSVISESGLYALIMTSRLASARVFRKWVTSEVLPAIRKTGAYVAPVVAGEPIRFAPHIIEIHHQSLPPAAVPAEEDLVCQLLAEVLGMSRRAIIVHGSTLFDAAVRDGILLDWIGHHRIDWQRRGRFLHRLRAYCGRWLGGVAGHTYYWVAPQGYGRARRYQIESRPADPRPAMMVKTPAPEAVAIVAQALGQGGEVIVK